MIVTAVQLLAIREAYWSFVDNTARESDEILLALRVQVSQIVGHDVWSLATHSILTNIRHFARLAVTNVQVRLWHSSRPPPLIVAPMFDDLVSLEYSLSAPAMNVWVSQWVRAIIPQQSPRSRILRIRRGRDLRRSPARSPARSPERPRARSPERPRCTTVCVICLDNNAERVLIPCGHVILCKGCAEIVGPGKEVTECPLCRGVIHGVYPVYC